MTTTSPTLAGAAFGLFLAVLLCSALEHCAPIEDEPPLFVEASHVGR